MPKTRPPLLDQLRDSGLLQPAQLEELARLPEAGESDPKALAKQVLQRGWLTRFQITQIAQGRGHELFLGSYVLIDRIGEGGMGAVFKAQHQHMGRVVALKIIRKDKLSNPKAVERFKQEVKAVARLHHPNIALAFDAGEANGTHFLSMEFVDGQDLSRLVHDTGPLPVAQACDYIRQAALGLQHAHERGLVHRDIKPNNLLVTLTPTGESTVSGRLPLWGTVKLLDLGLARLEQEMSEQDRALTREGAVLGTPDFLAPEQALGAHTVDARADLYSLGCTFYFLLSGRPPFHAESVAQLLLKHQLEHPTPLETLRSDIPEGVLAIIRSLLAKEPDERIQTAGELAAALEPFSGGGPSAPVPAAAPAPESAWASIAAADEKPRPARARAQSADDRTVALEEEEPPAQAKKPKPRKGRKAAPPAAGRTGLLLALAGAGALVVLVGVTVVGAGVLLLMGRGRTPPAQTAPAHIANGGNNVEVPHGPGHEGQPGQGGGELPPPPKGGQPLAEGELQPRPEDPGARVAGLAFSSDGDWAVAADGTRAYLWGLKLPRKLQLRFANEAAPVQVAFLPGSHQGFLGGKGQVFQQWDLEKGERLRDFPGRTGTIHAVAVSENGQRAFAAAGDAGAGNCAVHVWDVPGGGELYQFKGHPDPVVELTLAAKGKRALSRSASGVILWDTDGGKEIKRLPGAGVVTAAVLCPPDGRYALLGTADRGLLKWDAEQDRQVLAFQGAGPRVTAVAVSADGRYALSGNQAAGGRECSVCVWDVNTGQPLRLLKGHTDAVTSLTFSLNNRLAGSSSRDGTVRLWPLRDLAPLRVAAPP
jgi:serine/threonine-protein kinase